MSYVQTLPILFFTSWIPRSSHVGAQSGTHLVHLNGFSPWLVLLMNLKVAWCRLKFLEVTRSYISTEAFSHLPSALECPFSGGVLLCYFKSFNPENLLTHFCTKNVSLQFGFPIFLPFTWSWEAHGRFCAPIVSLLREYFYYYLSHLMNRTYCHIRCTWMPSLLCESSHKTLPVGNSLVFLQVTRLWEALVTHSALFISCVVSLHQFTWSQEARARPCAPIVSLL